MLPVVSKPIVPMKRPKLTIVGMACRFGALENLDAVERAVYNGTSGACDLPEKRWRFSLGPLMAYEVVLWRTLMLTTSD